MINVSLRMGTDVFENFKREIKMDWMQSLIIGLGWETN